MNTTIERLESQVRSYSRSFPTVFDRAQGSFLYDRNGKRYIDFFAGAGVLNYGHNHAQLRETLLEYIAEGGIVHGLDMATDAKCRFLETFERIILKPRNLTYKAMFPGPTGTNAVEAALKLARKVTGRRNIVAFTNAFHGMTLGALAATGNAGKRAGAAVDLANVTRMPFDGYLGDGADTIEYIDRFLSDSSSGVDAPAAFIVETVQAEGGVRVASAAWMRGLAALAKNHGALLIVDDIQVGCGRTGQFFSFESFGVTPDIVCLSKALSGFGLPFSLTLFRPELDVWNPGEHNGTFRGNNLAFVTAAAALELFWTNDTLARRVEQSAELIEQSLRNIAQRQSASVRGRGLLYGIEFCNKELAQNSARAAFRRGLVIETAGAKDEVLKILPALTIDDKTLQQGLKILSDAVDDAVQNSLPKRTTKTSLRTSSALIEEATP